MWVRGQSDAAGIKWQHKDLKFASLFNCMLVWKTTQSDFSVVILPTVRCCASVAYAISGVSLSVCLSVCLSVTFVHSDEMNKHIFKIFSPSGSHTILVFPYQMAWQYSYMNPPPLAGTLNAGGVGRNRDFEPISGFTVCCEPCQQQVQYT